MDGTTDAAGVTDEVLVELDGVDVTRGRPVPPRPDITADVSLWRAYAVALGLNAETAASWDTTRLSGWCG